MRLPKQRVGLAVIVGAFTVLFGGTGFLFSVAALVLCGPVYYLVRYLKLSEGETVALTPVFAVGLYSSYGYFLGFLLGSLRVSIAVTFLLLTGMYFGVPWMRKWWKDDLSVLGLLFAGIVLVWLLAHFAIIQNIPEPAYVTQYLTCLESYPFLECTRLY